jgi:glutathionylspermidine synthase
MQRHSCNPRPDWRERVEATGLTYHTHDTGPYWDESACYELSLGEVTALESAAKKLHFLCIDAAEAVIERNWWHRLGIPPVAIDAVKRSWERDDFSLYGRFDLAFDGKSEPKLLEYNADTPTALVEAAVTQWFWMQDTRPDHDQFNSIHERLIEAWKRCRGSVVHFCSVQEHPEDEQTVTYLRDTCEQAGVSTRSVYIEDLGWNPSSQEFVDLDGTAIRQCFKLYPWEWLWHESFGPHLCRDPIQFIEPAWKMLLSNKGLLPILWELFPDHPNLLPAWEQAEPLGERYIRKPKLSREGANVTRVENGEAVEETEGDYGTEGFVYQAIANLPSFHGNYPVFGTWIVDHEPAGLGIREDTTRITGNLSRFVPHFLQG